MKIQDFSLSLTTPFETAQTAITARDGYLVRIDNTTSGIGEATPLPGWTEPSDACAATLRRFQDTDADASDQSVLDTLSDTPAARHGLSLAIKDRDAKHAGQPLYQALGGQTRVESLPVNATIGDTGVENTVEAALRAVNAGFECLKIKVGSRDLDTDVARLAAVRDAVGAHIALRVDANGSWSLDTARAAITRFADLDLAYIEQPLALTALDGLANLRGGEIPIAVDESLREYSPRELLRQEVADIFILKPMVLGGLDHARTAAQRVRDAGLDVVITTTIDAVVARTSAVHLAASLPTTHAHGLATGDRLRTDLAADPAPVKDGRIQVPQQPGHGVRGVW